MCKYFKEENEPNKRLGEISSRLEKKIKQGLTWRFQGCRTNSNKPYGVGVGIKRKEPTDKRCAVLLCRVY